ncbi:U6 snRNA-associated Sm-like protein LSm5p [Trypanosoma equiperdum]|uniref:U6 snRNA-associated Sm-like protein LSm5p n=5 Tax=Trypanozoon TaxID=39700 RepID=D6XIG3_TRYB2|nr:U6 snRNA-associated Sm-like protein LSm5p,putative [Trypanosoma brucei gambiense DAL972]XP_845551.1 U6 snRNA-associated Sm-like protein LSm5p [Trypanosoma brucei brucei TREU927]AAS57927.1 Lsm5p [Trypanosoma brucei]RHW72202.1 U6 snRNA-associated Sm-like protein LSm5p [Trypanosoma brucei equiperdum]SCU65324.1 U6 snRNA-associated Sm-like protein LSm5p [Trypanosoma equiperdum]AAX79277.1 U6 snRNA-associated Sm-like protein LSm5p [Trypanosoma brucei]AAZ11992.1 U6 snRNA-associated Sm-like protein|eukprot:XP_011774222.1 U6 snRNA-associated Sm-like protein LSm5p,putative [Trypanosoma brucei gambiense DAL972]
MSVKSERRSFLSFLGCRVSVDLDDGSTLVGRLVSFSPTSNLILTDAERRKPLKRRRGSIRNECYNCVLFVRGSSVLSVKHSSGVTTDATVIDSITGRQTVVSKTIQAASQSLDTPLR